MSYEETGVRVYLAVTLATYAAYVVVLLARARGDLAATPYAGPMLACIGASIALSIVLRVVLGIALPGDRHRADERDRGINRLGEHVGGLVLGTGMVVPFALTLAGAPHFWIANAMYAAFTLWAIVVASVKLVAYRRGF
ncbi:hypothetical protein [Saccharothrix syringae]|uniref:DUF2178 domain-containing protein n=1 Tax=Saccharothrix syringae TaxID=103733 RepID=A0A5Q0GS79_SACSY|nr:hypothetical protein [Saccharothrix syringae]QFZ16222.1 hypothetical protein EKG83_00990 [Saccharothrix syringae]